VKDQILFVSNLIHFIQPLYLYNSISLIPTLILGIREVLLGVARYNDGGGCSFG